MLNLQIGGKTVPFTKGLTQQDLLLILDNYNSLALQKMLQLRGQKAPSNKEVNLRTLAATFLDENYIARSLQNLLDAGSHALAWLMVRGVDGVMPYSSLKQQLSARYGPDFAQNALQQLIGNGLALYAFQKGLTLSFDGGYNKHTLEGPGSLTSAYGTPPPGIEQVVWALPQVTARFKVSPQLKAELQPLPLQSFESTGAGRPAPQPVESVRFETLLADLFSFTRYVEQNRPKVLQSGDLGKRDFTKLSDLLSFKDSPPPQPVKKLDELPHLNFLWQLLRKAELLKVDERTAEVLPGPQLSRFFQMSRPEQARLLLKAWAASDLEEFTRIPTLRFYTYDPAESSIPVLQKQKSARNRLIAVLEELYSHNRLPQTGLEGGWLDFGSLLGIMKEEAYEILLPHAYQPETSSYGSYYSYGGDFGRGYYKGFTSKIKPADPTAERKKYGADRSMALSLDRDWDWVEGEWINLVLGEAWNWLGLVELGLDAKDRPIAFRFTPSGLAVLSGKPPAEDEAARQQLAELAQKAPELARPLLVQPNFEIMVLNPVQNLPLVRRLEEFATQMSLGDVAQYRMSKESVLQGLRGGMSVAEMLGLLHDNSRVPVSQNIETSLQDWAASFERLAFWPNATVIEVGDSARLDALVAAEPGLVLRRLGPTFVLVAAETADKVAHRLAGIRAEPATVIPVINTTQAVKGTLSFKDAFTLEARNATPYQLYRLGQFAELVNWEVAGRQATFKLTAESVGHASRLSLTFAAIRQTCENWLAAPAAVVNTPKAQGKSRFETALSQNRTNQQPQTVSLPVETRLALKGWLGEYGDGEHSRLGEQTVVALQVPRPDLLDDILAVPELNTALVGRIGPGLALVRPDRFEALKKRLESFGLVFGADLKFTAVTPSGILPEALITPGRGGAGVGDALLAMFEQSFRASGGKGRSKGRSVELDGFDLVDLLDQSGTSLNNAGDNLAALLAMENTEGDVWVGSLGAGDEDEDEDDFDEGDTVIFLLEDISLLLSGQVQSRKLKADPLAALTSDRFAEELLSMVEMQGRTAKKRNDLYWDDKHEDAHFYEELTPAERRQVLLSSCLEAMPSEVLGQRRAAVNLLPLYGNSVARQITEFLYHPIPAVRFNACRVLGEVGDRESIAQLQAVLDDQNSTALGTVASAARQAVEQIEQRLK